MAHKNWDHLRDIRKYSYFNQQENQTFIKAMQLEDISQESTAIRQFVMEQSNQIIIRHRRTQFKQQQVAVPTVTYSFPSGSHTVLPNHKF